MRFLILIFVLFLGCDDNPVSPIYGCTNQSACNFNPDATIFDDSCIYGELNICNECGESYNCFYGNWYYESQSYEVINFDNQDCIIGQKLDYQIFGDIDIYSDGTLGWSYICDELWNWEFDEFWQSGEENEINLKTEYPEFIEWKWVEMDELPKIIVEFKKKVYEKILLELKKIIY